MAVHLTQQSCAANVEIFARYGFIIIAGDAQAMVCNRLHSIRECALRVDIDGRILVTAQYKCSPGF